jgi:uncharacterized membrane protein YjgN (DUF898 family)
MDAKSPAPETPTAPSRNALRFEGTAGEYFKIWIVNLALTILTLGIFSAWAKVRSRRYFYGNTILAGHGFDYHGQPLRILIGRAIAAALLLGYSLTVRFAPVAVFGWVVVFFFAMPWLVKSSLRFNARNTSYRNIRFDFVGTYFEAMAAFTLWWMLAAITLFTTLPLAHRARDYYIINNRRFGGKAFEAEIPGRKIYGIYGMALLFILSGMILVAICIGLPLVPSGLKTGNRAQLAVAAGVGAVAYVAMFLFVSIYVSTRTLNLALNSTKLNETLRFEANLSPWAMIWIGVSNLVLVLVSLGLLYPWSRIRSTRYMTQHIAMLGTPDMNDFVGSRTDSQGVIGEEVANFFDIDIGL